MNISVVLCTRDRCKSLADALASLAVQSFSVPANWEVLVVDNNSTDNTREVAHEFCQRYPDHFRYVFEGQSGKSYALNAGIESARGEILAFTDDDIVAEPTWLENLTSIFADESWAGSGGRTLPEQGFVLPDWLSVDRPYALAPLGIFDLGTETHELSDSPFGNNMAYRRVMFEKYGVFRTDLGPRVGSTQPQKSEDSEFGLRVLAAKERIHYEPSAVIYHSIPKERMQKQYFLAWWFDKARADVRAVRIPNDHRSQKRIPVRALRRLLIWTLRWIVAGDPARRFECKTIVWWKAGEIQEYFRLLYA